MSLADYIILTIKPNIIIQTVMSLSIEANNLIQNLQALICIKESNTKFQVKQSPHFTKIHLPEHVF